MKSNKYKLINGIIAILIPLLFMVYLKLELELKWLNSNNRNHKRLEILETKDKFELSEFLSELAQYENVEMNNIVLYDTWGEVNIQCEGNLNEFRELLRSIETMEEVVDISDLFIEENLCNFILVFNR